MKLIRTLAGLALAVFALAAAPQLRAYEPTVGIQTWTLRNMTFDQVVEFAEQHHVKYLQMIGTHIDPNGSMEETKRKKAILDSKGLVLYTFGVTGTSLEKEKNRKLFEFAKFMGVKVIVVEPQDYRILDNLEELVKEYDIKIAIHNHGIATRYGNPLVMHTLIDYRDPRIGVCLDVGWITAAGFDAAKIFKDYKGRVYDIHLKDKKIERTQNGPDVYLDVMVGTGQANYKGLFEELKKAEWPGIMSIETDNGNYQKSPAEFVDGAIDFVKKSNQ